jgi:hypothetical protein
MRSDLLTGDDQRFDRLVDGELSPEEYRAVVSSLDQEPGAWRSCALAFLESQALAGDLGCLRKAIDRRESRPAIASPPSSWRGAATLLAMAASFLLVFGLGVTLPGFWNRARQERGLVGNTSPRREVAADGRAWNGNDSSGTGSSSNASSGNAIRHAALRPIGNVRLVVNGADGQEAEAADVPVYEIGQNLEEYLRQQTQPTLDPLVIQWLEQQGHEVELQQQFIAGQLADGRPMYVPVEEYRITPVRRSY